MKSLAFFILLLLPSSLFAEELIDTVVASVDGKPITLSEIQARVAPKKFSLSDFQNTEEGKKILDAILIEKVIALEAESRGLQASSQDVENYIAQVASQNGMNSDQFVSAVNAQGKSYEQYKKEIQTEILKTKLLSSEAKKSVSITDEEVIDFIKRQSSSNTSQTNSKITLLRMVFDKNTSGAEAAEARVKEALEKLKDDEEFEDVAEEISESKEEDLLLGTFAESELSEDVRAAVSSLNEGEYSIPLENESSIQVFYVKKKVSAEDADEDSNGEETPISEMEKNAAREVLKDRKTKEKMASFVLGDLLKKHSVDKKI